MAEKEPATQRAKGVTLWKTVSPERCSDKMLRVIDLPAEVETGKITATLRNGVLQFVTYKAVQAKVVRVKPQSP